MIYFAQSETEIKIGYSENASQRLRTHKAYGYVTICALAGSVTDEEKLHKYFMEFRVRGNEFYQKDDKILDYCTTLISKQFAHPDPDIACFLPDLPYSAWGPEHLKTHNAIEPNGQISIFSALPAPERLKMVAQQAQNHSFTDEWYTPGYLIELVRSALGDINTDPATSFAVNLKFIKAKTFYTKETNGLDLSRPWHGNVFLNPPYGKGENSAGHFIARLCDEFSAGNVKQAITCLNAASLTSRWFYSRMPEVISAHCFINGRPNFIPPDGKTGSSPNKGIVFSYLGNNVSQFFHVFKSVGQMLMPMPRDQSAIISVPKSSAPSSGTTPSRSASANE